MLTYRKAVELLPPGDTVWSLTETGNIEPATVLEVCNGWLETNIEILDFEDHGRTWWLTKAVATENSEQIT
ncbi:MAG: hypothetical protein J6C98_07805 [Oscillospiraceae bacterium]|nr:hypothetical protein [Oscillospiraceae bacterium]